MRTRIETNRNSYEAETTSRESNRLSRTTSDRAASALHAPDLTQRPPRSLRSRLGGYALLPRMLDKGRATIAGKNGDYSYDSPLDQHILKFAGIDPRKLLAELNKGKGDGEILDWIN